jgi:hypothetical protein
LIVATPGSPILAELKVRCYAELAKYVHPKRKAMDLGSAKDSEPLKVILERF